MRFVILTLQLLALLWVMAGCTSISATSGVAAAPTVTMQKVCPPEAMAPVPKAPAPPKGVDAIKVQMALIDGLGPELGVATWAWLMTGENPWSIEVAARLQSVHQACVAS